MLKREFINVSSLVLFLLMLSQGASWAVDVEQPNTTDVVTSEQVEKEGVVTLKRVITATRTETPTQEYGGSISTVTKKEIKDKQYTNIGDALRGQPGVDVVQQGAYGGTTSLFIRGAKSEHTLFMVDGVEINDPITPSRTYSYANLLPTENVERIEILRGPQSTLYGSDAIGGVINVITERGEGKPSFYATTEGGSYGTFIERAGLQGGNRWFNYSLGTSRMDSDGISAASKADGNTEKDGFGSTALSARIGFTPRENFNTDVIMHYLDSYGDIDNAGGAGGDDPNYRYDNKQLILRTQAALSLLNNHWQQKMGFSLVDHNRDTNNGTDVDHPLDLSRQSYDGKILKWDWQHDLYLGKMNTITLGAEHKKETASSDYYSESMWGPFTETVDEHSIHQTGLYAQNQIKIGNRWFNTLGLRWNHNNQFGDKTTYQLATAYLIPETGTRLKASYGTGFKAPSVYQLYSAYGNLALEPETSTGWDAGVEQNFWHDRLGFGATIFNNHFKNMVDYDVLLNQYFNVTRAKAHGVEMFAYIQPMDNLFIRTNYTYNATRDEDAADSLLRRPRNKVGADVNYRLFDRCNLNLGVVHVGGRDDYDYTVFPSARVVLDKYTLVNLTASYDLNKHATVFGRVQNVFGETYEEVKGYGALGTNAYVGLKFLI